MLGSSQYSVNELASVDKKFFLDLTPFIIAVKDDKIGRSQGPMKFKINKKKLTSKLEEKEALLDQKLLNYYNPNNA
jgi:hypothetical protein